ncbi:hypothetical protein B0293_19630 [Amycolatopsis azurea DSM 43854]|uniref:Uncharacterized protein n=1 Tax=Amycolatopsis azurea DSM 43854 TaxID=1238180 RepID=M2QR19_9PSEU|nr:hypothetical protein C791_6109 [Amycolatopsis azurea DSM 43854]OOC05132.1 hypothetical protein B0293_19630 [Amycolatopsis azurea DSM 43854]
MILGALLVSLLAACTDSVDTPPPPPQFPKWQPKQPRPADRDEPAVDAALAALDFCQLIDLAVYDRRKGGNPRPVTREPKVKRDRKTCTLYRDGYEDIVDVRDVDPGHTAFRNDGAVVDLGGVKGYQVETRHEGVVSGCAITVPVSFRRAIKFELGLQSRSKDCELLRDFTTAGVAKLPRDLVYPPDGQDNERVGTCANWVSNTKGENCDPAVAAQVPTGAELILAAGAADPNVECAVFRDAVKKTFGPEFEPIATPGSCYFVEPRHRLQIEAGATANGGAPGEWHADPNKTYKDHRQTSFSGNPGVTFRSTDDREFSLYVSPLGNLDSRGHVRFRIAPERERGIDDWDRSKTVSAVDVARAHAVMELVMATHFRVAR